MHNSELLMTIFGYSRKIETGGGWAECNPGICSWGTVKHEMGIFNNTAEEFGGLFMPRVLPI